MSKLIKYLNEVSIEECLSQIEKEGLDKVRFIRKVNSAVEKFNLKIKYLVEELSNTEIKYIVGDTYKCRGTFSVFEVGEVVKITEVSEDFVTLNDIARLHKEVAFANLIKINK